ncbi:MAG: hypothetical protein ACJ8AO_18740 [Gemmatimonadaceae bacterium]
MLGAFGAVLGAFGAAGAQAAPQTYVLVVAGIGGEKKYADEFFEIGAKMSDAAVKAGVPAANVTFLAEDPARDAARVDGKSTREAVRGALAGYAERLREDDRLLVLLVGHGSMSGDEPRFNLPGPDLGAADFARLLKPVRAQVAFVNASSASGDFLKPVAGPRRVVVTATKSGFQRNHAVFGRYFVDAFATGAGDADKDGRVSLLEAYAFARREVQRYYEGQNALQTEHAQLDDDGDGAASGDTAGAKDGARARAFVLGTTTAEAAVAASPAAAGLLAARRRLEEQVEALKRRKGTMPAADYDRELERLLVELATTNAAIRKAGSTP